MYEDWPACAMSIRGGEGGGSELYCSSNAVTGIDHTSSSAIAESPRDALCPSVVSFSSTVPRAQIFIICYFSFRFTSAYN